MARPPFVPTHGHTPALFQSTNLSISCWLRGRYDAVVTPTVLAAATVDWSEVHAVRLLGVALAVLFLLWAIRRMFGGKK